jgi:glutamate/tyrosine decarboxylase-like PLP-dependent enzyme
MRAMFDWDRLAATLANALKAAYAADPPVPSLGDDASRLAVPSEGRGDGCLADLLGHIVDGSAHLASLSMIGHMDTAPDPIAVIADAVASALNNNLLFRELSPLASRIEETLVSHFAERIGFPRDAGGVFQSGGSAANLCALFGAMGGFSNEESREGARLFVAGATHSSIAKSAHVLGLAPGQIETVPGDAEGRMDPGPLDQALSRGRGRKIVAATLGSTVHGAVEPLADIAACCARHGAWLHVDAVFGGALMYSEAHGHLLRGIEQADSVALGPQKWMYVPRLCAVVLMRDRATFEQRLAYPMPYSVTGEVHRGQWGIQSSRRTDPVPLWVMLQVYGTRQFGRWVDHAIDLGKRYHALLSESSVFRPTHVPDLNVLCFRLGADASDDRYVRLHKALTRSGRAWVSLARWKDALLFRSVLLNRSLDGSALRTHLADLEAIARDTLE